ncbi:hypothetical protein, partial [Prevotella sp.]|uniref:hypothetical protein n=1 Tax=Prevotella sp. TaxID=59823 RepID=UPI004029CE9A
CASSVSETYLVSKRIIAFLTGVGVLVPNTLVIRMVTSMFLGFSPLKKGQKWLFLLPLDTSFGKFSANS